MILSSWLIYMQMINSTWFTDFHMWLVNNAMLCSREHMFNLHLYTLLTSWHAVIVTWSRVWSVCDISTRQKISVAFSPCSTTDVKIQTSLDTWTHPSRPPLTFPSLCFFLFSENPKSPPASSSLSPHCGLNSSAIVSLPRGRPHSPHLPGLILSDSLSHRLTLSLSNCLTLSVSFSHRLTLSLSHCLTLTQTHCLTLSQPHCHTLTLYLSQCLTVSLSHCLSLALSMSHCFTLSLSHGLSLTQSDSLTVSFLHCLTLAQSHFLTVSHSQCLTLTMTKTDLPGLITSLSLFHSLTLIWSQSHTVSLSHRLTVLHSNCFILIVSLSQCLTLA